MVLPQGDWTVVGGSFPGLSRDRHRFCSVPGLVDVRGFEDGAQGEAQFARVLGRVDGRSWDVV